MSHFLVRRGEHSGTFLSGIDLLAVVVLCWVLLLPPRLVEEQGLGNLCFM